MAIRSFLAFELPPDIKTSVTSVSRDLEGSDLNARRVKVDNIHLTVVFMGEIKEEDTPEIRETVKEICLGFGPFDISLKGIGVFPNPRKPRILWLGLEGEIERMSMLRDRLQERITHFGIKQDKRPFRPHLTLARFRKPNRPGPGLDDIMTRFRDIRSPVCSLNELIMFKSELRPQGAVYTRLDSWPLE